MTMNDYQKFASVTANKELSLFDQVRNGCYGMCGESGECIDILKKHEFQGHDFNPTQLVDEMGDVLWYIAQTASGLGVTLEYVAQHNIDKLKSRYPEGFNAERSIHRDEKPVKYREEHRIAKPGDKIKLVNNGGYDFSKPGDVLTVDGVTEEGLAYVYGMNHLRETDCPDMQWFYEPHEYVVVTKEEEE